MLDERRDPVQQAHGDRSELDLIYQQAIRLDVTAPPGRATRQTSP